MSIPVLNQVYDEMRRLAIAGSVTAGGDFRLKKLLPPLEQAGAKAPVFAKVAETVKGVVESKEKTSANALLELTSLVNAILYTQGNTGLAGNITPIETAAFDLSASQASARVLKPLLEALTTTGSGRLEQIREAFERGAFRDLRLMKPAIKAIDDPYPEIGELIAEKVLPLYGKAILPDLKAKYDQKGKGGHARRLKLMHKLDAEGTRDLVKQALEEGSKEVKIGAIECLGPDDLSYLIEQASAKAQDVRRAAYEALSTVNEDESIKILRKAMTGKDLSLATGALTKSRSPKLLDALLEEIDKQTESLFKLKEKKAVGEAFSRLDSLVDCLENRDDSKSEDMLLKLFDKRADFLKLKGEGHAGFDFNSTVIRLLENGTKRLQSKLVEVHSLLPAEDLDSAFRAAQRSFPPNQVYEIFSPYLLAKVDEKKKNDPSRLKRDAVINSLTGGSHYYYWRWYRNESPIENDPRWLDLGVQIKNLEMVQSLVRPGHAGAQALLKEAFDSAFKKAKEPHELMGTLSALIRSEHPDATDAYIATIEKQTKKSGYYYYWLSEDTILSLPKSAIPKLESLIPKLGENEANQLVEYVQKLRQKA